MVGGVKLAGIFAGFLLLDGAQRFKQGKGVIGQDDEFGVVGLLLSFQSAGFYQPTQQPTDVILRTILLATLRVIGHISLAEAQRIYIFAVQVIFDFSHNYLAGEAKTIEFGQFINAQQNRHVVALPVTLPLGAEKIEKVGRQNIKRIIQSCHSVSILFKGGAS